LLYSNVKGKNPFRMFASAKLLQGGRCRIDQDRVMRGLSTPSPLMIAPHCSALSKDFTRPKFDPDAARSCWPKPVIPTGSK